MPLRLPGIDRRRQAIRPKATHPTATRRVMLSSAAQCVAAPRLAASELSTAGILSVALPRSLRPRCGFGDLNYATPAGHMGSREP
jgi:hypothetical protein